MIWRYDSAHPKRPGCVPVRRVDHLYTVRRMYKCIMSPRSHAGQRKLRSTYGSAQVNLLEQRSGKKKSNKLERYHGTYALSCLEESTGISEHEELIENSILTHSERSWKMSTIFFCLLPFPFFLSLPPPGLIRLQFISCTSTKTQTDQNRIPHAREKLPCYQLLTFLFYINCLNYLAMRLLKMSELRDSSI